MKTQCMDKATTGRLAKSRGKADERWVAKILGGARHPADTGGGEDVHVSPGVATQGLCVQVKGGQRLLNDTIRSGLDAARAAMGPTELGCLVVIDRPAGRKTRAVVVFDLIEFARYHGYGIQD